MGETDNYRRRFVHYAKPGPTQSTNIRMRDRLLDLLNAKGGQASVEVATGIAFMRDGQPMAVDGVPDVFVRRLLENAALVTLAAVQSEIVNGRGYPAGEL